MKEAAHIGPPLPFLTTRKTHLNSSLLESWGSKTEQTQTQSGPGLEQIEHLSLLVNCILREGGWPSRQSFEKCLSLFQVGSVKTLGKPAVNLG